MDWAFAKFGLANGVAHISAINNNVVKATIDVSSFISYDNSFKEHQMTYFQINKVELTLLINYVSYC